MRALWAVYKRELAHYFRSMIAYGIAFALMLFFGLLFNATLSSISEQNLQSMQMGGGTIPADVMVTSSLGVFTFLQFIFAPLLTMRLLSEESREGTLEVLMTLPMKEWTFIVGKFLAAWTYYTLVLALTLVHVFALFTMGMPDLGLMVSAYAGAWLYGGAVLALALIWSAITEDQIVAAFLGAATILMLYIAEIGVIWASSNGLTAGLADIIREFSLQAHYQATLLQGIVRAEDIAYFVLIMIGSLFITTRFVETRRWRA